MTPDILNTLIERDLPAAQGGDTVAYGRLVAATQRMVASVALAITRDLQASEDIAHETFLTAWQRRGQLDNPQSFLPWLRQVARNRAIDHVRARRYRETPVDPLEQLSEVAAEPGHGPSDSHERSEQARQLAEALDEIPETSRDVLGITLGVIAAFGILSASGMILVLPGVANRLPIVSALVIFPRRVFWT